MAAIKTKAAKEAGIKGDTKVGVQTQKWLLTRIAKDDRISPSKRILCTLLLGYIENIYPFSLIEDVYGNPNRLKFSGTVADDKEVPQADQVNKDAADDLKLLYKEFKEIDDANTAGK